MAALRFVTIILFFAGSLCVHSLTPQQQRYHVVVPIPANEEAHFKILNALDGSYHFGYDTGLMKYQSFREEIRDADGHVRGKFGFIDPQGVLRITEYVADTLGYRTRQTTHYLVKKEKPLPIIGPIPSPLNTDSIPER
ncbi:cuticle protein 6-like [Periplaneta americana]|uniref:cuticle protein 6-like n=1 Tax=Periplaneta americana TaxID=6978 RepID=UPI0037E7DE9F